VCHLFSVQLALELNTGQSFCVLVLTAEASKWYILAVIHTLYETGKRSNFDFIKVDVSLPSS
jgi:hypothetical protein